MFRNAPYYAIPSTKSERSTSFGFGQRFNRMKRLSHHSSPAYNQDFGFDMRSDFDGPGKGKGYSFGTEGRIELKNKFGRRKKDEWMSIGPGHYHTKSFVENLQQRDMRIR